MPDLGSGLSVGILLGILAVLGLLDGGLSGFRAAQGRTGRLADRRLWGLAMIRGTGIWLGVMAVPTLLGGVLLGRGQAPAVDQAARGMLAVCLPYAVLTLLALGIHLALPWRLRFLAMALILGPFTLVRPLVSLAGGALAWWWCDSPTVGLLALVCSALTLAVEPLCSLLWYRIHDPLYAR